MKPMKTALVTGGGKGIGRAISETLAEQGWRPAICGRDREALERTAFSIESRTGVAPICLPVDLAGPGAALKALEPWVVDPASELPAALVCNASDYGALGALTDVDFGAWRASFELNFFSVAELIHRFARTAIERGQSGAGPRRKIVVMSGSGLGGSQVWPGISAYGCAKAAIYRLVEHLHVELFPQGFDVNCVAPGAVKSGMPEQARKAGERAVGGLYEQSLSVLENGGDSPLLAAETVARLLSAGCDGLSGRLISAKWDKSLLDDPGLVAGDKDLLRLRRIDNALFGRVR